MTRGKVVIIGAGFGGLNVARGLAGASVDVTLVVRTNFHTFLPLLYQVATAGLNAADVAHAVRGIVRDHPNVAFRRGTVAAVDWDAGRVELESGEHLPFDHLVVAAGATAAFFGIPGAAEHSHPLYTLADAAALRNHVLGRFEAADGDLAVRHGGGPSLLDDGALTFVIVGGGATGVEVAGALAELFTVVLRRDFPRLDVGKARIVLVEMGEELLPAFGPTSRADARATLEARGVEVRTGEAVAEVTPTRVVLRSGEELAAHTLIWAAGVQASPLAATLAVETARGGRIVVGDDLRIVGHPDAFAIGDVAAIPDLRSEGGLLPGVAQVAIQSGQHVAAEIPLPVDLPFVGRQLRLSGTPGWLSWLGLHLVYLIGFRNRASVLLNWAWNYLTWDRGPRLIFGEDRRRGPRSG